MYIDGFSGDSGNPFGFNNLDSLDNCVLCYILMQWKIKMEGKEKVWFHNRFKSLTLISKVSFFISFFFYFIS